MSKILVVDDETGVRNAFQEMLVELGHEVTTAGTGEAGLELVRRDPPQVVITDLSMPGMGGLETFRQIRAIDPKLPVIIMTGRGTMDTAIEATKLGAFDYQLKPFEPEAMLAAIERALESVRLMARGVSLNPEAPVSAADAIIGESIAMQEVFKSIGRVAPTDATVLIRGESGTGKELVARAIYQHSLRASAPLLVVNCVAIPEALLESELFGYERGAFTGAHSRKIGKFEQAHGGTIFLDEIGDIPLSVQAKLLRVLQQRTLQRVGGNETIQVDVRILAATNRPLERAIADSVFRDDLYHRLNVVSVQIPPLSDRRGDIPKLVQYFLERYSLELKIERPVISDEALDALCQFDWPGNVRQLEHCIYRVLIFTRGYPIQVSDVRRARDSDLADQRPISQSLEQSLGELAGRYLDARVGERAHEELLDQLDRVLVEEALRRTNGNQTHAARMLGLSRPTLHAKMQRHGIAHSK
ncbi:MAG TPA: sigma-54 dependent transcriptional regulator [Pirellulaceae bacterium]|nr:sigma-54 dependent transcriptional regulator [Pirellulaceae bacterium]